MKKKLSIGRLCKSRVISNIGLQSKNLTYVIGKKNKQIKRLKSIAAIRRDVIKKLKGHNEGLRKQNIELVNKHQELRKDNSIFKRNYEEQRNSAIEMLMDTNRSKEKVKKSEQVILALKEQIVKLLPLAVTLTEVISQCEHLVKEYSTNVKWQNKNLFFGNESSSYRNGGGVNKVNQVCPMVQGFSIHRPTITLERFNHFKLREKQQNIAPIPEENERTPNGPRQRRTRIGTHQKNSTNQRVQNFAVPSCSTANPASVPTSSTSTSTDAPSSSLNHTATCPTTNNDDCYNNNSDTVDDIASSLVSAQVTAAVTTVTSVVVKRLSLPLHSVEEHDKNTLKNSKPILNLAQPVSPMLSCPSSPSSVSTTMTLTNENDISSTGENIDNKIKRKNDYGELTDDVSSNKKRKCGGNLQSNENPMEGCSWMFPVYITNNNNSNCSSNEENIPNNDNNSDIRNDCDTSTPVNGNNSKEFMNLTNLLPTITYRKKPKSNSSDTKNSCSVYEENGTSVSISSKINDKVPDEKTHEIIKDSSDLTVTNVDPVNNNGNGVCDKSIDDDDKRCDNGSNNQSVNEEGNSSDKTRNDSKVKSKDVKLKPCFVTVLSVSSGNTVNSKPPETSRTNDAINNGGKSKSMSAPLKLQRQSKLKCKEFIHEVTSPVKKRRQGVSRTLSNSEKEVVKENLPTTNVNCSRLSKQKLSISKESVSGDRKVLSLRNKEVVYRI